MLPPNIQDLSSELLATYKKMGLRLAVAESCTGGMIAAALTDISGSSAVFDRGFVTYSNDSKVELLGVLPDFIASYGAVSAEVAEAMADGAVTYSQADVALAVTGVAGPEGGSEKKPVGTVFFGLATKDGARFHYHCRFEGDRDDVRLQAVAEALRLALILVKE